MKTFPLPVCLTLVLLALVGCFAPLKNSVVSEQEIGVRPAGTAHPLTAVVRRVVKQIILSPMTEEGYGKDYLLREQYFLKCGAKETRLGFLEINAMDAMTHAAANPRASLWEIEPEVWPIAGTTSWIAIRMRKVDAYLDVKVIVFDEALQHREIVIERVQRRVRTTRTFIGNLEFAVGNRQIVFHKDEGRLILDPLTLALTKA